jgi:hypothetical protein
MGRRLLDGLLTGMLLFKGERCWFKVIDETEETRKFSIIGLSLDTRIINHLIYL